jgi:hypothetical protein
MNNLKAVIPNIDQRVMPRLLSTVAESSARHYQIRRNYSDHTPIQVVLILFSGSLLIGAMVGLIVGSNKGNFLVVTCFYFITLFTILAIHDMDNADGGAIRPSFESYKMLKKMIEKDSVR